MLCERKKTMFFSNNGQPAEQAGLFNQQQNSPGLHYRSVSNSSANHPLALMHLEHSQRVAKAGQLKNKSWHCFLPFLQDKFQCRYLLSSPALARLEG